MRRATFSYFNFNSGSDEGTVIFNGDGIILVNNSQFISNSALSYGGAIDNGGQLAVENSIFDSNQAYGAGAIDNGGNLTIVKSIFRNNKATMQNGGAMNNKGNATITGSIFENNSAKGNGGAIIARRSTTISYSIIYNNPDKNGYNIFNETWENISISNNWWGFNNPEFAKLLNFQIGDEFKWIIMDLKNTTNIVQDKDSNIIITFNKVMDKNNRSYNLNNLELLPVFEVSLLNGEAINVVNGYFEDKVHIPITYLVTFKKDNQSFSFEVSKFPTQIIKSSNIVEDYSGKTTFKVRIIGENGSAVAGNVVVYNCWKFIQG